MAFRSGIDVRLIFKIASVADADPRTVDKVLSGGEVRPRVALRIERALADEGITVPAFAPDVAKVG